ncbi:hypothetical protein CIK05_14850 [Bdellovibrio sp. qaytius]|nr:hypothetical protein CIK05_14850 [Bdellovibrio sp. qaytius]
MKNKFYMLLIFSLVTTGFAAHAVADDTLVDNSVKYGEKYLCEITTTDEKTYTLDLEWNSEASKFSQTPEWQEKIVYSLTQNAVEEMKGSFQDKGMNLNNAVLKFGIDTYQFSGVESTFGANDSNTFYINIELSKTWVDNKKVIAVNKFKASHYYEKYVSHLVKEIELAIKSSNCTITAPVKQ